MKKIQHLFVILGILILIFAAKTVFEKRGRENEGNLAILTSMNFQDILVFKIFHYNDGLIEFTSLEPALIQDFFKSLSDVKPYSPNHDTSQHGWFLEISAKGVEKFIPARCYIPYDQRNVVVVDMMGNDGYFQSQQLYDWYQTYSHRWLTPENDRDSE